MAVRRRKRRMRYDRIILCVVLAAALAVGGIFGIRSIASLGVGKGGTSSAAVSSEATSSSTLSLSPGDELAIWAENNGVHYSDYPQSLVDVLWKSSEIKDFVYRYPFDKDKEYTVDLSAEANSDTVPLLMQWDKRWGYRIYGSDVLGLTGCGPTSLSMVALYRLNDASLTPAAVAKFSTDNGYCVPGNGTAWALMSEGARKLGLKSRQLPLDKSTVIKSLKNGDPIICIMGKGDFTTSGHFIVMVGVEDGKIRINDCNSRVRSEKLWEFDDIKSQIRNLWVYEK